MALKQKEEIVNQGIHNTMALGTSVKGDVFTESDFRLDGLVEGNINCKGKLVIGPKGKVMGQIHSINAEILGEVDGTIQIENKLIIKSTAVIKGDITTQVLEIEPSARFNGSCSMSQSVAPKIAAPVK